MDNFSYTQKWIENAEDRGSPPLEKCVAAMLRYKVIVISLSTPITNQFTEG